MEELLCLIFRLGGKVYTKLAEGIVIHLGKYYGGVDLGITELGKSLKSAAGIRIVNRGYSKGDKHLVGMKTGVVIAEVFGFESLDRCEDLGGDDIFIIGYAGKSL